MAGSAIRHREFGWQKTEAPAPPPKKTSKKKKGGAK